MRGADGIYGEFTPLDTLSSRVRVGVGDVNGDGIQDVFALDQSRDVYLYAGQGDGTFGERSLLFEEGSSAYPSDVFVLDPNQDDRADLLVLDRSNAPVIWMQGSGGSFSPVELPEAPAEVYSADLADLDKDGVMDILVATGNGIVYYYRGRDDGSFASATTACYTLASTPYGLAVADFDEDGALDIVVSDGNTGRVYSCRGGGDGTAFFPAEILSGVSTPSNAALEDLDADADGHRDLLVTVNGNPRSVQIYPGNGDFSFETPSLLGYLGADVLSAAASGGTEVRVNAESPRENQPPASEFTATWNTGAVFQGDYQVLAVLTERGDERSRSRAEFRVLSDLGLAADVGTDRGTYATTQLVDATGTVSNTTVNADINGLHCVIAILDPDGQEVTVEEFSRDVLGVGETLTWHTYWVVDASSEGLFSVELRCEAAEGVSAEAEDTFQVTLKPGLGLLGDLTADPEQILPGEAIDFAWSVTNNTPRAIHSLPLRLLIAPADSESILRSYQLGQVDIDAAGAVDGIETADMESLEMGSYRAVLQAFPGDDWTSLALADFIIVNLAGTLEVTPTVVEGGVDDVQLNCTLRSLSDSVIEDVGFAVEIRDTAMETLARFSEPPSALEPGVTWSGSYVQPSSELVLGRQYAVLTANVGDVTFELVEVPFDVIDTVAPEATLSIVGPYVEEDGVIYIDPDSGSLVELTASDNFSGAATIWVSDNGSSPTAYSQPFPLEEGTHTITFQAEDAAGNDGPAQSVQIVADATAPVVTVGAVADGGCVVEEASPTVSVEDDSPVTMTMTLDGAPYDGTPVTEAGDHTLEVVATDIVGNTSTTTVQFTIETGTCACVSGDEAVDRDGDGQLACEGDCDDEDPTTYDGAEEVEDGVDNDCDGLVDDGLCPSDLDGDGIATAGGDCDDSDPEISPAALEVPDDGVDNDCDGLVDEPEEVSDDMDNDGVTPERGDCNDKDTRTHPAASDAPNDGRDNDCDGLVDETREDCDGDRDGYSVLEGDCDGDDPDVGPGAEEVCDNGVDDNCDGTVDEGCGPTPTVTPGWTETPPVTATPPLDVGGDDDSGTPPVGDEELGGGCACAQGGHDHSKRAAGDTLLASLVAAVLWRRRRKR